MNARPLATLFVPLFLASAAGTSHAQYDYGGGAGYGGDGGFVVELEGALVNPRNTDNIVAATSAAGLFAPIIPEWDDDFAGRIALGWEWSGKGKLLVGGWAYTTENQGTGTGIFSFPIGPGIPTGSGFAGATGTFFDITTEITAHTIDLSWSATHQATDAFLLEWLVGARYASYEETAEGSYADSSFTYLASKSNKGEMIGARAGVRGDYRFGVFSLGSGIALSLLDGELEARSSLFPQPPTLSPSAAALTDDSRSGTILDFDVTGNFHLAGDRVTLSFGWGQSVWQSIAEDLVRNLPGAGLELRPRDGVTFSGYKAGIALRF
jgi:hypothetical protein